MTGILSAILCWIKQIGAMVLNALIDVINLVVAGLASAVQALLDAWPIDMPTLPGLPSELQTAFAWVKWTPLPVHQGILFLLFMAGVWAAWSGIVIVLRWAKAVDA